MCSVSIVEGCSRGIAYSILDILCLQNSVSSYCDEAVKLKNQLKVQKGSDTTETTKSHKQSNGKRSKTLIMTTSMARDIKHDEFNKNYTGGDAVFNRHHGGVVETVSKAMEKKMEKMKPDIVVIQAGGNDLQRSISPLALANEIVGAGKLAVRLGATVAVCSILPRASFHLNLKRWETNILLRGLCQSNNLTFIDNKEIVVGKHLLKDGVHLNTAGTQILSSNIIKCLDEL